MSAARDRIARAVNAYVSRRLQPLEQDLASNRSEIADLRSEISALGTTNRELLATVNTLSRRRRDSAPIRCLFLVHYMEAWDSIADVYAEMDAADDFAPLVASIPRRLVHAPDFGGEQFTHERLDALGVPHIRLNGPDSFRDLQTVKHLDPHLILRQSQWDADVPPAFATEHLAFARLALIPYETMSLIEAAPPPPGVADWLSDTPYHRSSWAVFCANEYVREFAARTSPVTQGEQFIVTGHPKPDRIRRTMRATAPKQRPFTVTWSAHHSLDDEWSRFGMFHLVHDDMLTWAEERPEWSFVFSPHPSLSTRLDAAAPPLTPKAVAGFRERWDALPNTSTFTAAGYGSLFAHSDLMVTDGLSMLLEYQLANKPVVHLKRPDHRPFSTMGRIAQKGFHSVGSVAEARVKADGFAAGQPDPLAQAQREVVQELFGDHRPAKEIVEHIRRNW